MAGGWSRRRVRALHVVAVAASFVLLAGAFTLFRSCLFRNNLHVVIPGQVYRSAAPTTELLESWKRELGLRSVVRLNGERSTDGLPELDLQWHELDLSAQRWPTPKELTALLEALEAAPRPTLIQCLAGVDRSGLAAAFAALLAGQSPEQARSQFSWKHGYPGTWLGSELPEVVDRYAEWLSEQRAVHSVERLREWARSHYIPGFYRAEFHVLEFPERITPLQELRLRVQITNRSPEAIPFADTAGRGVRLVLKVRSLTTVGHFKYQKRLVSSRKPLPPGAAIEVAVVIPLFPVEGRYEVRLALVDEVEELWFFRMGSPDFQARVEMGEPESLPLGEALPPVTAVPTGEAALPSPADFQRPVFLGLEESTCPDGAVWVETEDSFTGPARWCERHGPSGERVRHGPAVFFGNTGDTKRMEGHYRDGRMHGRWLILVEPGLAGELRYFAEGKVNGRSLVWDENGRLREVVDHYRGMRHGWFASFWADGSAEALGPYVLGKKHGPWTWWNEGGGFARRGGYELDQRHGVWTRWYENGQKRSSGEFRRGLRNGLWTFWTRKGIIRREIRFEDGVRFR